MQSKSRISTPRSFKSTLVEPFKQLKLGIWVLVISSSFVVILCILIGSGLIEQYQQVVEIFKVVNPDTKWELIQNEIVTTNAIKIGVAVIAYMVILFSVVFSLTHRFYGPLVSIQRFVAAIIDGDYQSRISVRKKDELQSIALKLNEMAAVLEKRHFTGTGNRRGTEEPRGRRDVDLSGTSNSPPSTNEIPTLKKPD